MLEHFLKNQRWMTTMLFGSKPQEENMNHQATQIRAALVYHNKNHANHLSYASTSDICIIKVLMHYFEE